MAGNGYPWHSSDEFHEVNSPEFIRLAIANEIHNYETQYNRELLQSLEIEETPFVTPTTCRATNTLVLKTPQNCYRAGVIEQLYPNSQIIYIVVERNKYATVNGLLDGWESGMFMARPTPQGWWKFDMPPNWTWKCSLLERCINQYQQSMKYINHDYLGRVHTVQFEIFETNWLECCQHVWGMLGLSRYTPACAVLPILSATDNPKPDRWKAKRPWLVEVF